MNRLMLSIAGLLPLIFIGQIVVTEMPQTEPVDSHYTFADHQYVGVKKCKTCHRKEEVGGQFGIWEATGHAQAFATLGTDRAKELGAEKGIDDPQTAAACLKCHVTGYDAPAELLGTSYDPTEGVTCEACHGAGADYRKKKVMIDILLGNVDGEPLGLVIPNEETCLGCHNEESPAFNGFNFEERLAEIAHPIPDARKAEHTGG